MNAGGDIFPGMNIFMGVGQARGNALEKDPGTQVGACNCGGTGQTKSFHGV